MMSKTIGDYIRTEAFTKRELEVIRDALSFYMRSRSGHQVSGEAYEIKKKVIRMGANQ